MDQTLREELIKVYDMMRIMQEQDVLLHEQIKLLREGLRLQQTMILTLQENVLALTHGGGRDLR